MKEGQLAGPFRLSGSSDFVVRDEKGLSDPPRPQDVYQRDVRVTLEILPVMHTSCLCNPYESVKTFLSLQNVKHFL